MRFARAQAEPEAPAPEQSATGDGDVGNREGVEKKNPPKRALS
jgi:hypothetical protein